jgi:hypothetical protein
MAAGGSCRCGKSRSPRTLVFDDPRRVRAVFEELLSANMNLGRPGHVQIIFGSALARPQNWQFTTRLLNRADQVTINLAFKHSRIKIYLKEDRALRVETVINDLVTWAANAAWSTWTNSPPKRVHAPPG